MAVDTSAIGKVTGAWRVTVERTAIEKFADAVRDPNPIYHDEGAASAAGFDAIPAPPTFSFSAPFWGSFAEDQPDDPTGGENPMHAVMGSLMATGGLVLHGEESFEYHRPIQAGDVLSGEGKIVDIYEKETSSATMTFLVMETTWRDDASGDPVVTERFNLIHRL